MLATPEADSYTLSVLASYLQLPNPEDIVGSACEALIRPLKYAHGPGGGCGGPETVQGCDKATVVGIGMGRRAYPLSCAFRAWTPIPGAESGTQ